MNQEEMMTECINLFPKCEWKIDYKLMKDAGNELTPYYFILFGHHLYIGDELESWEPLYLDKDGNEISSDDNYIYECALYEYEGNINEMITNIYNNIKNLIKK